MLKRMVCVMLATVLALGIFAAILTRPANAIEITKMSASEKMVEMIRNMEGFVAIPQWDYGQWTVGFGTRCPDEHLERYKAEGIPLEEAYELMAEHISGFENEVNSFMIRNQIQLNQQQFDAMVSFVYNVGFSVLYNNESTVIKAVLNGADGNDFMYAIGQWCTAGGEFLQGLFRRRMIEAYMYLDGTYSETLPSSFCYVMYNPNGGKYECRAQGYDSNLAAVPLSVPVREGYIFTGWYTAAEGGEKVTALDETTNGLTLYAQWKAGTQTPDRPTDPATGIKVMVTGNSVSIRQEAGDTANIVSHVYRGEWLTITGLTEKNGKLWGYCSKGWICLEYTDYYDVTHTERPDGTTTDQQIKVPVKATVLSTTGVTVYGGPHTSYPQKGTLKEGDTIQILETATLCNQLWGRYEGGWVRLNQRILLHDDQILAHSFTVKVTYYFLNVRSGPGTNYAAVAQLNTGDEIEIFALVQVNGVYWGRFTTGWVYLDGNTNFNAEQLPYYQNHSYGDWYCDKEASCSQFGQERRDCQYCEHYELRQTPMIDHTLGDWYVSKEGNCVEEGQERRDCTNCEYFETRTTALGGHGFGEWYTSVEANCVTEGQQTRKCLYCDHFETQSTGLGDHSFGEWTVTTAPGCETAGQEQRNCTNCTHTETREVAATGHSFGEWTVTTAPGCETVGQEQRNCTNCTHTETREVAATGHSYGQWYVSKVPTADTEGEERRDCANCEHYETNVLPVNPHIYGEWYVHTEATCAAPGEERRNCSHCDGYESRPIAVKEHSYGEWFVSVEASCTAIGQEKRQCQNCEHFETREIALKDHSLGDWYVSVEATCTAGGQEKRQCQNCDHFETRETAVKDHSYGEWFVSVEASCTAVGQEKRQCQNCDHFETREIAVKDHSYGEWSVSVEASCTAVGQEKRQCQNCDHFETRETAVKDHSYGEWFVSVEASCTAVGQEKRECQNCDHFETRETALKEHSYGEWYVVTEPTIDSEGQKCRECANCDAFQTETLPMVPSVEKVYATITGTYLNVRESASLSVAQRGVLYQGLVVEVLEQKTVDGKVWGRIEFGWILLTGYTSLETVREPVVEDGGNKTYAVITCNSLSVRPAANSFVKLLASIYNNARVRVYEIVTVGDVQWGRTAFGWIWLSGYTTLEEEHVVHSFGDWYVSQAGTCVTPDQERRDCVDCDHYETRAGQLGGHVYGDWFVIEEASCAVGGKEQRNCELCDHYEIRDTAVTDDHVYGDWYISASPDCTDTGLQCRDCLNCDHYESQQIPAIGHSFGEWYVVKEATTQVAGLAQRDCVNCDHYETEEIPRISLEGEKVYGTFTGNGYLNIRSGAGTQYGVVGQLYAGYRVEILEQVDVNGTLWGRIEAGWVCITGYIELEYVQGGVITVTKLYATVTNSYLTIRQDATSASSKLGTLSQGAEVEILEIRVVSGKEWGRIAEGWICLTGYTTLATKTEESDTGVIVTLSAVVTYSFLRIRQDASTSAEQVGILNQGDVVQLLEIRAVNGKNWGHIAEGWILLTDNATVEMTTDAHLEHTFGDWYVSKAGTCATAGQERRDCKVCDHYEVRDTAVTDDHVFGEWYVAVAPGCETAGQQRRDCTLCDHYESHEIDAVGHSLGDWYVSVSPDCTNAGLQRRDCANCDHYESQQLPAKGHSFGQWYVTKEATTQEAGQKRRDCGNCDHYETEEIPRISVAGEKVYGTFTGTGYLNIRSGAGMQYDAIGQLYAGNRVEILEQVDVNGTLWGRIEAGWVCITGYIKLEYVQETVITVTKLYATVTYSYLTIRQGASSATTKLGTLAQGAEVEILEIRVVSGKEWGRIAEGWICLTGYTTLATKTEEVEAGETIRLNAVVTYSFLRIRQDASTSATQVGTLNQGDVVQILEIRTVNGKNWGRIAEGWILLSDHTTLTTVTDA